MERKVGFKPQRKKNAIFSIYRDLIVTWLSLIDFISKASHKTYKKKKTNYHLGGNHLEGGLNLGLRTTVTVFRPSPSVSSSVMISTAVVLGLDEVDNEETTSGGAARRVLAGEGRVMV